MEEAELNQTAAPGKFDLDPEIASVVEAIDRSPHRNIESLPIEEALSLVRIPMQSEPRENSEDRRIVASSGRNLRIRLYFPESDRHGLPILMHLHGGGFVMGSIEMDDARCASLAVQAGCIIASIDYPLAPEHPFPEPVEDAFSAWQWLAASATDLGGDPRRLAISGSSAGGHLAIGVCLLARERQAEMPLLQLLAYPVVDPARASATYEEFASGPFLTRARMAWFWDLYTPNGRQPEGDLWSPLSASLAGLPPAHVITAEYDVLRDEAETYAARLGQAGIAASIHRYPGMIHGFLTMVPDHAESVAALAESASALREAFAGADR